MRRTTSSARSHCLALPRAAAGWGRQGWLAGWEGSADGRARQPACKPPSQPTCLEVLHACTHAACMRAGQVQRPKPRTPNAKQHCEAALRTCDERGVSAHVWLDVGAQHPLHHLFGALPLAVGAQGCEERGVRGAGGRSREAQGTEQGAQRRGANAAQVEHSHPSSLHQAPRPAQPTCDERCAGHDVGAHAPRQHFVKERHRLLPLPARGAGGDDGSIGVACGKARHAGR